MIDVLVWNLRRNPMSEKKSSSKSTARAPFINPISVAEALLVGEHLSFRRAAAALDVRQSAVSRPPAPATTRCRCSQMQKLIRGRLSEDLVQFASATAADSVNRGSPPHLGPVQ